MSTERDYVLGTHDEEIARLGLQHRVWRTRVLDAWRRAGFVAGQTLLDVGCGPGWASLDLAEIAGPGGHVHAVDRSRRFLDALEAAARARGIESIETHERDLDNGELPGPVQGAWCRWVIAFVTRPRDLLERIHRALDPGGALVIHEYFDYSTWRLSPRSPEFEEFVVEVMESWRATGGEPDVGLDLPRWLEDQGFAVRELRTFVDIVSPASEMWQWPKAFVGTGIDRLVALGPLTPERGAAMRRAFDSAEAAPRTRLVIPAVVEIIATRS
jgi:SAM-dependent methyltransferase